MMAWRGSLKPWTLDGGLDHCLKDVLHMAVRETSSESKRPVKCFVFGCMERIFVLKGRCCQEKHFGRYPALQMLLLPLLESWRHRHHVHSYGKEANRGPCHGMAVCLLMELSSCRLLCPLLSETC